MSLLLATPFAVRPPFVDISSRRGVSIAFAAMTKTLAIELVPAGIRVNAIAPGLIQTRLSDALSKDDELAKEWQRRTPLRRIGSPDEISGAAVYLASDASSYVTGEVLVVDGGVMMS